MKEYGIREHFLDRIYGEYQAYKAAVLSCPNAEIFGRSYEIDVMVNFYEILIEKAGGLSEHVLAALLQHKNILNELYQLWLDKDDCNYLKFLPLWPPPMPFLYHLVQGFQEWK